MTKIKVEKKVHRIFERSKLYKKIKGLGSIRASFVGEFQYFYFNENGKISLISLPSYFEEGVTLWEIFCLEGNLFDDVERFSSKKEAEKRIKELLKGDLK
jgi:hypothetical protein